MSEKRLTVVQQKQIDEIMDSFDFSKVAKAMKAVNWEWSTESGYAVPNERTIRKAARKHLEQALRRKASSSSGGFKAEYEHVENESLSLLFILDWQEATCE